MQKLAITNWIIDNDTRILTHDQLLVEYINLETKHFKKLLYQNTYTVVLIETNSYNFLREHF